MSDPKLSVDGLWWHPVTGLPHTPQSHTYFPRGSPSSLAQSLIKSGGRQADLSSRRVGLGALFAGESRVRILGFDPGIDREFSSGPTVPVTRALAKVRRAGHLEWSTGSQIMVQRASYNFSHFLTEIAPSALLWQAAGLLDPDTELVVANMPAAAEVLRAASISRAVRPVPRNSLIIMRSTTVLQAMPAGFLAPDVIRDLARRVRAGLRGMPRKRNEVVFLSRPAGQRRSLSNQEEIIGAVRSVLGGIHVVDPSTMTLAEQVAAVTDARIIIGPHGAQLANLIWAERLEALVEILPYPLFDYGGLASALGIQHAPVYGREQNRADHYAIYQCDPQGVADAVRRVVKTGTA